MICATRDFVDRRLRRGLTLLLTSSFVVIVIRGIAVGACEDLDADAPAPSAAVQAGPAVSTPPGMTTGDLAGSSEFHLTQVFLADMLGVRRVSVTNAAGVLRKRKLIKYSKGSITILDRRGLGAVACGCYKVISDSRQQRVA